MLRALTSYGIALPISHGIRLYKYKWASCDQTITRTCNRLYSVFLASPFFSFKRRKLRPYLSFFLKVVKVCTVMSNLLLICIWQYDTCQQFHAVPIWPADSVSRWSLSRLYSSYLCRGQRFAVIPVTLIEGVLPLSPVHLVRVLWQLLFHHTKQFGDLAITVDGPCLESDKTWCYCYNKSESINRPCWNNDIEVCQILTYWQKLN